MIFVILRRPGHRWKSYLRHPLLHHGDVQALERRGCRRCYERSPLSTLLHTANPATTTSQRTGEPPGCRQTSSCRGDREPDRLASCSTFLTPQGRERRSMRKSPPPMPFRDATRTCGRSFLSEALHTPPKGAAATFDVRAHLASSRMCSSLILHRNLQRPSGSETHDLRAPSTYRVRRSSSTSIELS